MNSYAHSDSEMAAAITRAASRQAGLQIAADFAAP